MVGDLAKFRILHVNLMEFGKNWTYLPNKRLLMVVMDVLDTFGHSIPGNHIEQPHPRLLLSRLRTLKSPSISMPTIWVWIVNSKNKFIQVASFVKKKMMAYTILKSKYIFVKNERLFDHIAQK
jgi:hypothetical protein